MLDSVIHKETSMIKTNLYLTIPQMARLEEIKQETGIGYAETVRRALDAYLFASALTVSPQVASPAPASAKRKGQKAR